jgi:hypothetical protein
MVTKLIGGCINKNASIFTFLFSITFGLALIKFGDKKYEVVNVKIALFFMWVGLMQLLDLLIWLDLNCSNGLNRLAGILGPFFNYLQPIIFFFLFLNKKHKFIKFTIIIYTLILLYYIINYFIKGDLCSKLINSGHIKWAWGKMIYLHFFYICVIIISGYYIILLKDFNVIIMYLLGIFLLLVSYFKFNKNIGEFWCLLVISIPIIILIIQRIRMKLSKK